MSGCKVCTKLVFYLQENKSLPQKSKAVVHFYHTSNTVLVQGSNLMDVAGVTASVWLVKNLLQPLATEHITTNKESINAINAGIYRSATMLLLCYSCKLEINPSASNPKDQELLCNKCEKYFHKKCTDRKKATAHWRKQPWYCNECIAGTQEEFPLPLPPIPHPYLKHHYSKADQAPHQQ